MRDYYLFLDESKPNNQVEHFCLGGCIIEKNNYINNVIPFVQSIKNEVFNNSDVVLHETEIRKANGLYRCMRNVQTRTLFWTRMKELFLHRNALQKHVTTISFPLKQDNNIGLQIADFIPNVLKKYAHNLRQRTPSIKESIVKSLYDGGVNNERRFGLKIIP